MSPKRPQDAAMSPKRPQQIPHALRSFFSLPRGPIGPKRPQKLQEAPRGSQRRLCSDAVFYNGFWRPRRSEPVFCNAFGTLDAQSPRFRMILGTFDAQIPWFTMAVFENPRRSNHLHCFLVLSDAQNLCFKMLLGGLDAKNAEPCVPQAVPKKTVGFLTAPNCDRQWRITKSGLKKWTPKFKKLSNFEFSKFCPPELVEPKI